MSNSESCRGKVVAITGGTSGIGLALVDAFLAEGAAVITCARSADSLAEIRQGRPGLRTVTADVTKLEGRNALINAIGAEYGRLDVFISNAGRLIERDFAHGEITDAELAEEFALNLVAPVQLTGAVLQRFAKLEAIVLVSSGYALVSPTRSPNYGAAKAGLHGFADGLRRQLMGRGVHVVEVIPPVVDTPATAHRQVAKVSPQSVAAATLAALQSRSPMALVGQARWLPFLLRLVPGRVADMVART
jgi:uncharacterized oxidoreductase